MKEMKKAQVSILVLVLIILIGLIAILIVWNLVVPLVREKGEEVEPGSFIINLDVEEVILFETGALKVTVNRGSGKGEINGLKFVFNGVGQSASETIENNLRKVIIEESPTNPMYYEKMSSLLDELIKLRKAKTAEYEKYLDEIVALTRKIKKPNTNTAYPTSLTTNAKRALFDNTGKNEDLANDLDTKILSTKKDGWKDHRIKTREVKYAIQNVLDIYEVKYPDAEYIVELAKNQREY